MFGRLTIILVYVLFRQCNSQLCARDQKLVQDRANCLARKFDPEVDATAANYTGLRTSVRALDGSIVDCFSCSGETCEMCDWQWARQCRSSSAAANTQASNVAAEAWGSTTNAPYRRIKGCGWDDGDQIWVYGADDVPESMKDEYAAQTEPFGCMYTSPFGAQAGMIVVGFAGFCLLLIISFGFIAKKCGIDCRKVTKKYADLQAKFFLGEVHLVALEDEKTGEYKWSFWSSYLALLTSTVPILATWFITKSHFSSRLDKAVVLLFSISYGMLAELVVVLYPAELDPPYVFKFLVVTLPNAMLWNKLSERFDREAVVVDYQQARELESEHPLPESAWADWADRAKNMFFIVFSLGLCVITYVKLQEESNPKCFVVNFLFNAIVVAFFIQATKLFLDFYCKWSCVVNNYKTLGEGTWQRMYLDIAASLPPSADYHPLKQSAEKKESKVVMVLRVLKAVFCCCCKTNASESEELDARQNIIEQMKLESYNNLRDPRKAEGAIAEGEALKKRLKVVHADVALRVLESGGKHPTIRGKVEEGDPTAFLRELFSTIDKNGDGKVTKTEFLDALTAWQDEHSAGDQEELVMSDELTRAWNETDKDGNDFLTLDEFEKMLPKLSEAAKRSSVLSLEIKRSMKRSTEEPSHSELTE